MSYLVIDDRNDLCRSPKRRTYDVASPETAICEHLHFLFATESEVELESIGEGKWRYTDKICVHKTVDQSPK